MPRQVCCPICGAAIEWGETSPYRPFCSERCKLTDLGAWAADAYRVAAQDQAPGDAADAADAPDTAGSQRTTH